MVHGLPANVRNACSTTSLPGSAPLNMLPSFENTSGRGGSAWSSRTCSSLTGTARTEHRRASTGPCACCGKRTCSARPVRSAMIHGSST